MGKFVVKQTATGFKFDLKAGNGQVIGVLKVQLGNAGGVQQLGN